MEYDWLTVGLIVLGVVWGLTGIEILLGPISWIIAKIFNLEKTFADECEPVRRIGLKIVVDKSYQRIRNYSQRIKDLVNAASEQFRKQFKIEFYIQEIVLLEYRVKSLKVFLGWLKFEFPVTPQSDFDLVIGFAGKPYDFSTGGMAYFLGNYAVIKRSWYKDKTLIHEIGHLFGADDYEGLSNYFSVMNYYAPFWLKFFDLEQGKIVYSNKWKNFRTG